MAMGICIVGIFLISYSTSEIWSQKKQQQELLIEAKEQVLNSHSHQKSDALGILSIPALQEELPIIEGANEDELAKGVGHLSSTGLPGEKKQILLSGHRDTVFRKLGELKNGDSLEVKMQAGTYSYRINKTYIVDANDQSVLRSTYPTELLTLSTCYPFSYIGDAPDRYIIEAVRE